MDLGCATIGRARAKSGWQSKSSNKVGIPPSPLWLNDRVVDEPGVADAGGDGKQRWACYFLNIFEGDRIDGGDVVDQQMLFEEDFLHRGDQAVGLAVAGFALLLGGAEGAIDAKCLCPFLGREVVVAAGEGHAVGVA